MNFDTISFLVYNIYQIDYVRLKGASYCTYKTKWDRVKVEQIFKNIICSSAFVTQTLGVIGRLAKPQRSIQAQC